LGPPAIEHGSQISKRLQLRSARRNVMPKSKGPTLSDASTSPTVDEGGIEAQRALAAVATTMIWYEIYRADLGGWTGAVANGQIGGDITPDPVGIQAVKVWLSPQPAGIGVKYRVQRQDEGWLNWAADGVPLGDIEIVKRLEAIEIQLTGPVGGWGVVYQAFVRDEGWQEFKSNGAMAGTVGMSLPMEALKVVLALTRQ
jgi:bacillolysin